MIELKNVSLKYNMNKEKIFSFKEYIIKLIKNELNYEEFWALKDINLKIEKGEVVGLVGFNGAGKSTLLKIISQIIEPTTGIVKVNGRISPLIELGTGFDFDLTARENIYLNGYILGYNKKFIDKNFTEIVEFAELNEFIDVPLKNFSSGMVARLGFSISTIVKPDILIVDEILSVGDFKFQEKSLNKIKSMIKDGVTVLMVSHSIDQIEKMCDRVVWLENGSIKKIGLTSEICKEYKNS
nr:ABC transporter ATP-binding protein [uncultured Leptotrichia sp.]